MSETRTRATHGLSGLPRDRIGRPGPSVQRRAEKPFHVEEASIADMQSAIQAKQITTTDLVHLYLARIKVNNGTCQSAGGIVGPLQLISPGQSNY